MYDNNNIAITVLTPTYNRVNTLPKLYESLCVQTSQDFQWLIIDDGSVDSTEEYIKSLPKTKFAIDYYKKENGGKHTALNASHKHIKGELVVIVDSDDYLLPDAVEIISEEWKEYRHQECICGMSYSKGTEDGKHMTAEAKVDVYIDDHISYRINQHIGGDRCEVVRSDLFKKYPLPVFEGERFISEDMLWNTLGMEYKTVYRNKLVYICEYLEDGLTKSGRRLRLQCPNSMMTVTKTYLIDRVKLKKRIKATWLYICYALCGKKSVVEIVKSSGQSFLTVTQLPFGIALYMYWDWKYMR